MQPLKALRRGYDFVIHALAVLAGILLAGMSFIIVYDAALRVTGWAVPLWAVDATEYSLVFVTFLGAPWLVRERGHVSIQILTAAMSPAARKWVGRAVCAACAAICLLLAYRSFGVMVASIGFTEVSAVQAPRWLRFAALPVGFFFLGTEFLRLLVSSAPLQTAEPGGLH
jgi:TRAP-type C4-dicarboxylate transport system permease small subunit